MKKGIIFIISLLVLLSTAFSQRSKKIPKPGFCGYWYKDSSLLRKHFEQQLAFLQVRNGDTIVDVGSSSGSFTGAINAIGSFKNVHFILVDIDSNCLNATKVNNMIIHYQQLRGEPFNSSIGFVQNTTDSLWLPLNRYKKLWILNTLHEIPDKAGMMRQMAAVLQTGGELVIGELMPTEKRKIHGGCHQPLMGEEEIKSLAAAAGLQFSEVAINPLAVKKIKNPYYVFRFVKQ